MFELSAVQVYLEDFNVQWNISFYSVNILFKVETDVSILKSSAPVWIFRTYFVFRVFKV